MLNKSINRWKKKNLMCWFHWKKRFLHMSKHIKTHLSKLELCWKVILKSETMMSWLTTNIALIVCFHPCYLLVSLIYQCIIYVLYYYCFLLHSKTMSSCPLSSAVSWMQLLFFPDAGSWFLSWCYKTFFWLLLSANIQSCECRIREESNTKSTFFLLAIMLTKHDYPSW